jgi:hypothetical protein
VYVNGKLRPVETTSGIGGGKIKKNDGGANSTLKNCKKFCKCE